MPRQICAACRPPTGGCCLPSELPRVPLAAASQVLAGGPEGHAEGAAGTGGVPQRAGLLWQAEGGPLIGITGVDLAMAAEYGDPRGGCDVAHW